MSDLPRAVPPDLTNPQVLLAWQRNHLANERTFLAWCRTGLALFAFSLVIERFDFFIRQIGSLPMFSGMANKHLHTEVITMTTFGAGALVMVIATWRFWYIRRCINTGATRFSAVPDVVFTVFLSSIIVGLFSVYWHLFVK